MLLSLYFLLILSFRKSEGHNERFSRPEEQTVGPFNARRILRGTEASDTRPYMVYLRPATTTTVGNVKPDLNWLCSGVIVQSRYILTSAACIENTEHFYVVSGTHKWLQPPKTNDCINNGAMRAIWKCVPKTYNFDGNAMNNIRWMVDDVAVVMVEGQFNFERRIKGCDFIPQMVAYNNISEDMEKPGSHASIAGWGSTYTYTDPIDMPARTSINSPELLETDVLVIKNKICKDFWLPRYHSIIDDSMICGRDISQLEMSAACQAGQLNCRYMLYPEDEKDLITRRLHNVSEHVLKRSLAQFNKLRKARRKTQRRLGDDYGGFCENDHGGPLIVGAGKSSVVIGIITAYRTMNHSTRCVGPFLYTSVWKYRHLISCAIYKELGMPFKNENETTFVCRVEFSRASCGLLIKRVRELVPGPLRCRLSAACTAILRTSSTVLDEEEVYWRTKYDKKQKSKLRKAKRTKTRRTTKTEITEPNKRRRGLRPIGKKGKSTKKLNKSYKEPK